MTDDVRVSSTCIIPGDELDLRASRTGGPGGQHVNTTSSRIELRWDIRASSALSGTQRARLLDRLGHRLTNDGVLVLHASEHRSQHRNREAALARLAMLVADALEVPTERRPTRPTAAARRRRLESKRLRATTKDLRRRPDE